MSAPVDRTGSVWEETTVVGSSPSVAAHSHLDSTGKTSLQSCFPCFPWSPRNIDRESTFSQALREREAPPSNDSNTPLKVGWPHLARQMTETLEFESFCRFRELNVKNLLYYQAQIAEKEAELREVEKTDREKYRPGGDGEKEATYATHAHRMLNVEEKEEKEQCKLVLEIRRLLKEYNKALLRHAKISALPQPNAHDVEALRVWIKRKRCGIGGKGAVVWGDWKNEEKDRIPLSQRIPSVLGHLLWPPKPSLQPNLVRTQPHKELDTFTQWVEQDFMRLWHDICYGRKKVNKTDLCYNKIKMYSQSKMRKFTSFIATVVACALPTLAIDILATAKTKRDRLLYIGGFTILFSIGLLFFCEASTSRINIFTATAAFSAVLVVFAQN